MDSRGLDTGGCVCVHWLDEIPSTIIMKNEWNKNLIVTDQLENILLKHVTINTILWSVHRGVAKILGRKGLG